MAVVGQILEDHLNMFGAHASEVDLANSAIDSQVLEASIN